MTHSGKGGGRYIQTTELAQQGFCKYLSRVRAEFSQRLWCRLPCLGPRGSFTGWVLWYGLDVPPDCVASLSDSLCLSKMKCLSCLNWLEWFSIVCK